MNLKTLKWKAVELLTAYGDDLGGHYCTDAEWPDEFSTGDKIDFINLYHELNHSSDDELVHDLHHLNCPPTYAWPFVIAELIKREL